VRNARVHNFDNKKFLGKLPTGRPRPRLQQDIEVDITGLERQSLDWIHEV